MQATKSLPRTTQRTARAAAADLQTLTLPALAKGEFNAGLIFEHGKPAHWVIGLPGELKPSTWNDAIAWAKKQGGELPTRREQRVLFANAKEQFKEAYYWSGEQYADVSSFAWDQSFNYGGQSYWPKDTKHMARAVRRVTI